VVASISSLRVQGLGVCIASFRVYGSAVSAPLCTFKFEQTDLDETFVEGHLRAEERPGFGV